ncbi:MAG: nitroreductase family deazaflavin-dependent oxidoreductase [Chloroflexota bacterium]
MDHAPQSDATPMTPGRGIAFVRRIAGPLWLRSGLTAMLEVRGRQSGRPLRVALFPIEVDGSSYLLSQYGVSEWVRNLRAAGRGEVIRKGHPTAFTAVEVDGAERERVIAVFRARTPKPFRRDFERRPTAEDHPTFRVEPIG